jgi:hypothetical protein
MQKIEPVKMGRVVLTRQDLLDWRACWMGESYLYFCIKMDYPLYDGGVKTSIPNIPAFCKRWNIKQHIFNEHIKMLDLMFYDQHYGLEITFTLQGE